MKKKHFIHIVLIVSLVIGSLFFTSCSLTKDPIRLNAFLKEQVIRKALAKKFGNSKLEIIPYSFNLDVKGNVGYEENVNAKVDILLKGNNSLDVDKLKKSSNLKIKDLKILGISGAVDVKGQVSALGVIINVNEHFNF